MIVKLKAIFQIHIIFVSKNETLYLVLRLKIYSEYVAGTVKGILMHLVVEIKELFYAIYILLSTSKFYSKRSRHNLSISLLFFVHSNCTTIEDGTNMCLIISMNSLSFENHRVISCVKILLCSNKSQI